MGVQVTAAAEEEDGAVDLASASGQFATKVGVYPRTLVVLLRRVQAMHVRSRRAIPAALIVASRLATGSGRAQGGI